jgi:nitrogen-specific signal transduction histidine kinase
MNQAVHRACDAVPGLAAVLEAISQPVVLLDAESRCVCVNFYAEDLAQRTDQNILGMPIWMLFPEMFPTDVVGQFRRVMLDRRAIRLQAHSKATDKWYEITATPVGEGGALVLFQWSDTPVAYGSSLNRAKAPGSVLHCPNHLDLMA